MSRILATFLTGALLGTLFTPGLAADEPTPTEQKKIEREIAAKERELGRFRGLVRKLESASRRSSNSDRRRAVANLEEAMNDVIVAAEDILGSEYRITRHGGEADQVHSSELEESKGVRTRRRVILYSEGEGAPPPGYLRLARQQSIYVSCRTIQEQAIGSHNGALDRYQSLVNEFAGLLEQGIMELQTQLPPEPVEETVDHCTKPAG